MLLQNYVADSNGCGEKLSIIATIDYNRLKEVANLEKINTFCEFEGDKRVIKLTYGIPVYEYDRDNPVAPSFMPIVIGMSVDLTGIAKCSFPFSTRSFQEQLFVNYLTVVQDISKYDLGIDLDILDQYVNKFFGTNGNYYDCLPLEKEKHDEDYCVELANLFREKQGVKEYREHAIEIHSASEIPLGGESIDFIIMPWRILDFDHIKEMIKKWAIPDKNILKYRLSDGSIENYTQSIYDKTYGYYKERGRI